VNLRIRGDTAAPKLRRNLPHGSIDDDLLHVVTAFFRRPLA
jgi:hypothetical protein